MLKIIGILKEKVLLNHNFLIYICLLSKQIFAFKLLWLHLKHLKSVNQFQISKKSCTKLLPIAAKNIAVSLKNSLIGKF